MLVIHAIIMWQYFQIENGEIVAHAYNLNTRDQKQGIPSLRQPEIHKEIMIQLKNKIIIGIRIFTSSSGQKDPVR